MGSMTSPASDSLTEIVSRLDARLKRVDEERWLSSRYASETGRTSLIVLYSFYYELARVRLAVSDQTLGQIRFQWWREAIEEIERGDVREHDLVMALASELGANRLDAAQLVHLIDQHQAAFLAHDRGLEPEGALALLAAETIAREEAIDPQVAVIASDWAKLRRSEAATGKPARMHISSALRPALAHLRLRHAWAAGRQPGPTRRRLSILLAVFTGTV